MPKEVIPIHIVNATIERMKNYDDYDKAQYRLVIFKTSDVDKKWRPTKDYIGSYKNIKYASSRLKLMNSQVDIINHEVNVPPYIYINNQGFIEFFNGRNRFANLRENGAHEIPFIIEKKFFKKYKKIFA